MTMFLVVMLTNNDRLLQQLLYKIIDILSRREPDCAFHKAVLQTCQFRNQKAVDIANMEHATQYNKFNLHCSTQENDLHRNTQVAIDMG